MVVTILSSQVVSLPFQSVIHPEDSSLTRAMAHLSAFSQSQAVVQPWTTGILT